MIVFLNFKYVIFVIELLILIFKYEFQLSQIQILRCDIRIQNANECEL